MPRQSEQEAKRNPRRAPQTEETGTLLRHFGFSLLILFSPAAFAIPVFVEPWRLLGRIRGCSNMLVEGFQVLIPMFWKSFFLIEVLRGEYLERVRGRRLKSPTCSRRGSPRSSAPTSVSFFFFFFVFCCLCMYFSFYCSFVVFFRWFIFMFQLLMCYLFIVLCSFLSFSRHGALRKLISVCSIPRVIRVKI